MQKESTLTTDHLLPGALRITGSLVILMGVILFFIAAFMRESEYFYSFISGCQGVILAGYAVLLFSTIIQPIQPRTNTWFWVKRATFDVLLALLVIPSILGLLLSIAGILPDPEAFLQVAGPNSWKEQLLNPSNASMALTPEILFIFALTSQAGLISVILMRWLTGGIPEGAILLSFRHIGKLFLIIIAVGTLLQLVAILFGLLLTYFNPVAPQQYTITGSHNSFWLIVVSVAILAPICEELFFRGYLQTILTGRSPLIGIMTVSLLFAAIHFNVFVLIPLFIFGLGLGYIYRQSGNILIPIAIHATFNAIAVTIEYLAV